MLRASPTSVRAPLAVPKNFARPTVSEGDSSWEMPPWSKAAALASSGAQGEPLGQAVGRDESYKRRLSIGPLIGL